MWSCWEFCRTDRPQKSRQNLRSGGFPALLAVSGPYSFWFHTFAKLSAELRDITLFHELLNKQGKTYRLTFGPLIPPEHANGDSTSVIRKLKYYVERVLPQTPDAQFDPNGPECDWRDPPKAQV